MYGVRQPGIRRDDTRDSPQAQPRGPPPGATAPPDHVKTPNKVYEVFNGSANALPPGSGQNTAGGNKKVPNLWDSVKTVKWEDFKQVHTYPCARESFLMGIGGGFGVGGVRALFGAGIPKAANWAVGTFVFASWANWEFCQYRRSVEKAYMKRAVEIIDQKKIEKEQAAKAKKEERRILKEQADKKLQEAQKKSTWKFW